jgi:hypothetical protein
MKTVGVVKSTACPTSLSLEPEHPERNSEALMTRKTTAFFMLLDPSAFSWKAAERMALKLRATPGRAQGALLGATPVNGSAHK